MNESEECPYPCNSFDIDIDQISRFMKICSGVDVVSLFFATFVLALSFPRVRTKYHAGPRVFAVNIMTFDLLSCVCSFITNYSMANVRFAILIETLAGSAAAGIAVINYAITLRSLAMLVFNASFVPMLAMFIAACMRPYVFSSSHTTTQFLVMVGLSDAIPLAAYTINEIIWPLQGWTTALYFTATYILLTVQLVFTIFALRVIYGKAKELSSVQAKQADGRRKELTRVVYFAVGPTLTQLPFAIYLLFERVDRFVKVPHWFSQVFGSGGFGIRLITSAKPTVDAISVLIFLGEYRQNALAILRAIRKSFVNPLTAAFGRISSTGAASYQVQYTRFAPHSTTSSTPIRSRHSPNVHELTPVSS